VAIVRTLLGMKPPPKKGKQVHVKPLPPKDRPS
jgi:hypothetical protein